MAEQKCSADINGDTLTTMGGGEQGDRFKGTVVGRSTLTLVDQALSSAYGLVVGLAAAQVLSAIEFGVFAALYTTLLIARGVVRAIALEPTTIEHAGATGRKEIRESLAVTVGVSLVCTAIGIGAALLTDSLNVGTALTGGAAVIVLLTVDSLRLLDIAAGDPARAVFISVILLIGGVAILGTAYFTSLDLLQLLALMAVTAVVAIALRRPHAGLPMPSLATWRWVGDHRSLAGPLLVDYLAVAGATFFAIYLLAFLDLRQAGILRAAQMVGAPLQMLFAGMTHVVMTEGSREEAVASGLTVKIASRSFLLAIGIGLPYLALVYVARDVIAGALGATGAGVTAAMLAMVVLVVLTAPNAIATGLLRAVRRPDLIARTRLIATVAVVLATIAGAVTDGARGVLYYGIVAQAITLPLWWRSVAAGIRSSSGTPPIPRQGPSPDPMLTTAGSQAVRLEGVVGAARSEASPSTRALPAPPAHRVAPPVARTSGNSNSNGNGNGNGRANGRGTGSVAGVSDFWAVTSEHQAIGSSGPTSPPEIGSPADPPSGHQGEQADRPPLPSRAVEGVRVLAPAPPKPGGSLSFLLSVLVRLSWLILAFGILGALAGVRFTTPPRQEAVVSLPMALDGVDWANIQTTHFWNENWIETQLDAAEPGLAAEIEYRHPDVPQLTFFALVATGTSDEQATMAVDMAAAALIEARDSEAADAVEAERSALQSRISAAGRRLDATMESLDELRVEQLALIEDEADEALVAEVSADIWSLETERIAWERETHEAETELSQLDAAAATATVDVARLGEPLVEESVEVASRSAGLFPGAVFGLWVGILVAYLLASRRGRLGDGDHPRLKALGVPVSDLGTDQLDVPMLSSIADWAYLNRAVVSLIDTSPSAGAGPLGQSLVALGLDPADLVVLDEGGDETAVVGTTAILVVRRWRTRISHVLRAHERCEELDVPVARIVFVSSGNTRALAAVR